MFAALPISHHRLRHHKTDITVAQRITKNSHFALSGNSGLFSNQIALNRFFLCRLFCSALSIPIISRAFLRASVTALCYTV